MPGARKLALRALASAVVDGTLRLEPDADPRATEKALVLLPGIGPWTASYIGMRALGNRDAFLPADLGVKRAVAALGGPSRVEDIAALAERWRPWRSYAVMHLWHAGA